MSELFKCVQYTYRSKNLLRLNTQKKIPVISLCCSRSPTYMKLGHFTLLLFGVALTAVAVVVCQKGAKDNHDGNGNCNVAKQKV